MNSMKFFEVTCTIKQKLLENGTNTLATIPKILRTAPSLDSYNKISISCLTQTLQSYGIYLTKEESSALFSFLDKTNPKKISINDFLIAIRGKPNEERQACIDFVFNKFDKTRSGYAEASELRKVFNCIKHPRFLTGELNEDQIFYLYLKNFFDEPRSSLSKLEWDDYYAGVSATIDVDAYFIKLLKSQFKVE